MFVCFNNGGILLIIGVIMKVIDDFKIRFVLLVIGLL